jgi:hypothetical protein
MVSFSLEVEVYERLHQYAFEQHQSMASLITSWIMNSKIKNEVSWRQQSLFDNDKK